MPNTREKLVELLDGIKVEMEWQTTEALADHLIANGVTFQPRDIHWATEQAYKNGYEDGKRDAFVKDNNVPSKWISVTEKLPEEGVDVLCWYEYFRYGEYHEKYRTYGLGHYFRDGFWGGEVSNRHRTKVLAWMPLPEPPKGE